MEKQNPHRLRTGTGCEFHRADDAAQPTNNTLKKQDKRARYAGLTLSLFMFSNATGGGCK